MVVTIEAAKVLSQTMAAMATQLVRGSGLWERRRNATQQCRRLGGGMATVKVRPGGSIKYLKSEELQAHFFEEFCHIPI
ncbi:hypothetical protein MPLSOD_50093 [Mesorhizobium sp. SOD10]|nr:hypothetical protein MPLSOD_50093 [Mesorhizobium sp. SOD10]